ncbi:MAG: hypothetical protein KDE58_16055 [Caldilineaceae bacterium]|nr:hypothetical protein [Caldilineaceae bacterium]
MVYQFRPQHALFVDRTDAGVRLAQQLTRFGGRTESLSRGYRAAASRLRRHWPKNYIIVAVPVAAPETCEQFEALVDEVICAETPQPFFGLATGMPTFPRRQIPRYGPCWKRRR